MRLRKILVLLTLVFAVQTVFASTHLNHSSEAYTIVTSYFDIIYSDGSEQTALILAQNVDALYEKAAGLFNTRTWMRIPIVVSQAQQQLNAYYTAVPFNHIVVYDTVCDSSELAVFSETLLNVFYHELVHAVTANIRSPSGQAAAKVLGDFWTPSFLVNTNMSFVEGATVSSESADGEGRVNDGLSMSYLVQAKVENKFPGWKDVAGARDVYPSGPYYYQFGGAFNAYIRDKYGIEKYAAFWKEAGSLHFYLLQGCFKKAYGVSIAKEWKAFKDSIPVPENLIKAESLNKNGGFYSCLARRVSENENGIVYKKDSSTVCYRKVNNDDISKEKKLFNTDGSITGLAFSSDGRYLAVTDVTVDRNQDYCVRIYDMTRKSFTGSFIRSLKNGCILDASDGNMLLAGVFIDNSRASVRFYKLSDVLSGEFKNEEIPVFYEENLPRNKEAYSLCAAGNRLAYLFKDNGVWKLALKNTAALEEPASLYSFPAGFRPVHLSYEGKSQNEDIFNCSVTCQKPGLASGTEEKPGTLLRLAKISVTETAVNLKLQTSDVSGGVYMPVSFSHDNRAFFVSRFADNQGLSYCNDILFCTGISLPAEAQNTVQTEGTVTEDKSAVKAALSQYKPSLYQPFKYMNKGIMIPLSSVDFLEGTFLIDYDGFPIGASFYTMDPSEYFALSYGAGIDVFNADDTLLTANVSFSLNPDYGYWNFSGLLYYSIDYSMLEFSALSAYFTTSVPVINNLFSIDFTAKTYGFYNVLAWSACNSSNIQFTYFHGIGPGVYAYNSLSVGLSLYSKYSVYTNLAHMLLDDLPYDYATINPGLNLHAVISNILPFDNPDWLTLNMPVFADAYLIPSDDTFLEAEIESVLFSVEIQKSLPVFPFYCRRFNVTAGYAADWQQSLDSFSIMQVPDLIMDMDSMKLKHGITAGLGFSMAPTVGECGVNSFFDFDLSVRGIWYMKNEQEDRFYKITVCGLWTF